MSEIVLMFHDVYHERKDESGFQNPNALVYKISSQSFEEIVKLIVDRYKTDEIFLSFDDGGDSFIKVIVPILDKYKIKGHFFIATDFIGTKGFVSEEQLKTIRSHGHIVGSHTASHCQDLSVLSNDDIRREWESSIKLLESILCETITEVSIPNGNYDKRTLEVLSTIPSIKRVFTSFPQSDIQKFKSLFVIGRFGIRDGMSLTVVDKIMSSKSYRLQLRFRKIALSILKRLFGDNYESLKSMYLKWFR